MRTSGLLIILALVGAAALAATASEEPFLARLIRLEAAAAAPEMRERLASESLAFNAAFLELAEVPELRLNVELCMRRFPSLSPDVFTLYAGEPEFHDLLVRYGPAVIPPIGYFLEHEIRSVEVLRAAGEAMQGARRAASRLLGTAPAGSDSSAPPGAAITSAPPGAATTSGTQPLSREERGRYAIAFIREDGYDFLGQFVVDSSERVEWIQTERVTEAAADFFTSGIRALETRFRKDEEPALEDYLWAGVDLGIAAGAVKVLRLGRIVGGGARGTLAARSIARGARTALRVGRYGVPVAVAYAVVRHPSLVSGLAAQAATILGWPVRVVQGGVWFAVLLPVLLVSRLLLRLLIRPVLLVLGAATRGLQRLQSRAPRASRARPDPAIERIAPRLGDLPPPSGRRTGPP